MSAISCKLPGELPRLSVGLTLSDCSEFPGVDKLRAALNPEQLEIIEDIWSRYREAISWPKRADVVRGRGATQATLDLLDTIGGSFVFETESFGSSPTSIELTLLGSLLLYRQQDLFRLLSAYLDFLRDAFIETGLMSSITWREIQSNLELSEQELNDLFAAVRAFNFFWSVLEGDSLEGIIKLNADIDRLQDYPSGTAFLIERARLDYYPGKFSTNDRRNSARQKLCYIDEGSLVYFYKLEELTQSFVKNEQNRLSTVARSKAAAICIPLLSALLALAIFFARDSGFAGIAISVAGWSGVSLFGVWRYVYPRLVLHFTNRGSAHHPTLDQFRSHLNRSHLIEEADSDMQKVTQWMR